MLTVLEAGLQSTLQDAGRRARGLGIPASGAADGAALRLANALVGNPPGALALEITLTGPRLLFHAPCWVALVGAPFAATLDGVAFTPNRAVLVQAGQVLKLGFAGQGLRAILAVRGGFTGQEVFGSRSTALGAGFGGLGRALKPGDRLEWVDTGPAYPRCRPILHPALLTPCTAEQLLRVLPTAEAADFFTPDSLNGPTLWGQTLSEQTLSEQAFTVSHQLDRLGVRLSESVAARVAPARPSWPTAPGLVQVPPDGRPILLLPDAGTHGGYPAPLVVCQADLPRLGQLRPGNRVRFQVISVAEAVQLRQQQEAQWRGAEVALKQHWLAKGVLAVPSSKGWPGVAP